MSDLIDFTKARDAMLDMADTAAVDGDYEEAIRCLVAAFQSHIALDARSYDYVATLETLIARAKKDLGLIPASPDKGGG